MDHISPAPAPSADALDRRLLLSAAGFAGVAALSSLTSRATGGPLNPPAGSVTATGRTLDEVYNKIPTLPNGTGDGRTPIAGGTGTVFISTPGSYVLTGNIDSTSRGLLILASNVTLDLNGYRVSTSDHINSYAIGISSASNVTVRNGSTAGGAIGVVVSSPVDGLLLEDLRVSGTRQTGISINSTFSRSAILRRCHVTGTGQYTTSADADLTVTGILVQGDCHRIEDCTVTRFAYLGTGTPTFRGVVLVIDGASSGCMISGCMISHDSGLTGTGLTAGGGFTVYRNNTVLNFTTPYSVTGAVNGGGNV